MIGETNAEAHRGIPHTRMGGNEVADGKRLHPGSKTRMAKSADVGSWTPTLLGPSAMAVCRCTRRNRHKRSRPFTNVISDCATTSGAIRGHRGRRNSPLSRLRGQCESMIANHMLSNRAISSRKTSAKATSRNDIEALRAIGFGIAPCLFGIFRERQWERTEATLGVPPIAGIAKRGHV